MIEIIEVKSKRELRRFIHFPNILYRDDPYYVPELYISLKTMFDRNKYPFFVHSKVDFFLAYKANQVAGRIALIRNNNHILYSGEKCGFFGFFESINDFNVAQALLDSAVNWIKNEGLESIIGPENFTTNDSCGFLTEGFDNPPVFMMPYNKPYYVEFFESYGFKKKIDLVSYFLPSNQTPLNIASYIQNVEVKLKRNSILIRTIDYKVFDEEIRRFREIYNHTYRNNWGFVPLNEDEFRFQAKELKKIAKPGSVILAEKEKNTVAFVCAVPDFNQILIKVKNGRLFPFGFIKLLIYRKKITNLRILILGVHDEYRNSGIDALLYSKLFEYARKSNILTAEAGYVMENNVRMNSILKKLGGQIIKRYRLLEYKVN
jgi:ribosomal protein S18 acetylase RimI-like enzyme